MPGLDLYYRVITRAAVWRIVLRGIKVGEQLEIVAALQAREGEGLI